MLGGETGKGWIPVTDFDKIDALLSELKQVAPLGGTNLEDPFLKARTLTPQPDNIVLITDGLPTQSQTVPAKFHHRRGCPRQAL